MQVAKIFLYYLLLVNIILYSPSKAYFNNGFEVRDLEFTGSAFQSETNSWSVTNLNSGDKYSNCDGVDILGGYGVTGAGSNYEKFYSSVASHDAVYYCFSFYIIDSWDPEEKFLLYFNNRLVSTWSNIYHRQGDWTMDCGVYRYNDLGEVKVCGRYFLPTAPATSFTIRFYPNFDEDSYDESLGIRNIFLHFATKQTGQTEGLCEQTPVVNDGLNRKCTCGDGYYDSGSGCKQCNAACSTCFGSTESDCYRCKSPKVFNGISCVGCHSLCETCYGPLQSQCDSCKPEAFLQGNSCLPCNDVCSGCYGPLPKDCKTCVVGTYRDNASNECRLCNPLCSDCYGPTSTECRACNVGAFLSGNECIPCHPYCSDCFDANNNQCNACKSGYYFYIGHWCLDKCESPLTIATPPAVPALECQYLCPTNQYMDSDGNCHPQCDPPKNSIIKLERNYCEFGCDDGSGGLTYDGKYILPNGQCKTGCPIPFTTSVTDGFNLCNPPKCGDQACQTCKTQSDCPGGSYCDVFAGGLCLPNSAQLRSEVVNTIPNGYVIKAAIFPLYTPSIDGEIDDFLVLSIDSLKEGADYKATIQKLFIGIFQVTIEFLRPIKLNPIPAKFVYSPDRLLLTTTERLPKIIFLSEGLLALAQKADIGSNSTFAILIICSVGFALLGKLSNGWSFLALNQYLHYLLYLNLFFLEHIKIYLRSLKNYSMVFLNVMDTEDSYLVASMGIALPKRFKDESYPLDYFLNTGQIFGTILGALCVLGIVTFLKDFCGFDFKFLISVRSQLRWNGILRQILTYSMPAMIACFVQVHCLLFGKSPEIQIVIISFAAIFVTFGAILKMLYLISSIPVIRYAAKVEYLGYYRTLWEGLHTGSFSRYYYWALALRGILLAYVVVFFELFPYVQISILIAYQCGIIIFFVRGPKVRTVYKEYGINRVSALVEIGLLVMKLAMVSYYAVYDYLANGDLMIYIGWGMIGLGFGMQFTQAGYAIYCQLVHWRELRKMIYELVKKLCLKKSKTKIKRIMRIAVNQRVQH